MKIISAVLILLAYFSVKGETTPPNYNFSLKQLDFFYPGNSLENIQKQHGKGVFYAPGLHRFYLSHQRYRFPLFLQVEDNRSTGFHATLPTYFLHDVFHQELIDRYGKQDQYLKKENSAVYVWNTPGTRIIYSAQCTITCFPNYLMVVDPGSSTLEKDFSTVSPKDFEKKRVPAPALPLQPVAPQKNQ